MFWTLLQQNNIKTFLLQFFFWFLILKKCLDKIWIFGHLFINYFFNFFTDPIDKICLFYMLKNCSNKFSFPSLVQSKLRKCHCSVVVVVFPAQYCHYWLEPLQTNDLARILNFVIFITLVQETGSAPIVRVLFSKHHSVEQKRQEVKQFLKLTQTTSSCRKLVHILENIQKIIRQD